MFKSLIIASVLAVSALAFGPATTMSRMSTTKLSMSAEFLPGAVAPLGYFDPLGFCAGKTEGEVKVEPPFCDFAALFSSNPYLLSF